MTHTRHIALHSLHCRHNYTSYAIHITIHAHHLYISIFTSNNTQIFHTTYCNESDYISFNCVHPSAKTTSYIIHLYISAQINTHPHTTYTHIHTHTHIYIYISIFSLYIYIYIYIYIYKQIR